MPRVRLPRLAPLAALALLLALAACGGPSPASLTLTGVTPSIALPGATVTLQGTGFRAGQTVAFDGLAATVTATTATTITAVVPAAYGYPRITVAETGDDGAALEGQLFVGADYAGATTLEGVQAALDDLPLGGALRLAAGTYAAPGTDLELDNRMLFGAGATTVLEVPGTLLLWAQDPQTAVLADLRVNGNVARIVRGRVTISAADSSVSGRVLLDGVRLDLTAFVIDTPSFQAITVRDATIAVDDLNVVALGGSLTIEGSDLTVANLASLVGQGADVVLRASTLTATTIQLSTAPLGDLELDDVELTAAVAVQLQAQGGDLRVRDTRIEAAADAIALFGYGTVAVSGSALRAATSVVVQGLFGELTVHDTTVESLASDVTVVAYGPLVVDGGRLEAAGTVVLVSQITGDLTLRGTAAIAATNVAVITGAGLGGNNGTVRVEDNADVDIAGSFTINAPAADLIVAGNGPIVAGGVVWLAPIGHVALRDNQRIESLGDLAVVADQPGGRLTATGNAFVANAGAGTISLVTQAGELTLADNTYDGTLQTPNNP